MAIVSSKYKYSTADKQCIQELGVIFVTLDNILSFFCIHLCKTSGPLLLENHWSVHCHLQTGLLVALLLRRKTFQVASITQADQPYIASIFRSPVDLCKCYTLFHAQDLPPKKSNSTRPSPLPWAPSGTAALLEMSCFCC